MLLKKTRPGGPRSRRVLKRAVGPPGPVPLSDSGPPETTIENPSRSHGGEIIDKTAAEKPPPPPPPAVAGDAVEVGCVAFGEERENPREKLAEGASGGSVGKKGPLRLVKKKAIVKKKVVKVVKKLVKKRVPKAAARNGLSLAAYSNYALEGTKMEVEGAVERNSVQALEGSGNSGGGSGGSGCSDVSEPVREVGMLMYPLTGSVNNASDIGRGFRGENCVCEGAEREVSGFEVEVGVDDSAAYRVVEMVDTNVGGDGVEVGSVGVAESIGNEEGGKEVSKGQDGVEVSSVAVAESTGNVAEVGSVGVTERIGNEEAGKEVSSWVEVGSVGVSESIGSEEGEKVVSKGQHSIGVVSAGVAESTSVGVTESIGNEDGAKEVSKGQDGETGGRKVFVSGELEALERRRKRRTEIFVGGLSTDVKHDAIRRVFDAVGEVVDVRLVANSKKGCGKAFAFVRFASAADAQKALEKHPNVEICGKQCKIAPVEGNDTIFLGNIDKKLKNEDVIELLTDIGIQNMDNVNVITDPHNPQRNRGFAFLELQTSKDALVAFKLLQKKESLGKLKNVKVAWAEPLSEPDEEEMSKVKCVYAEYLPISWDEDEVRENFQKFGEIENVVLSRNLNSSKRKDFAFISFKSREAAIACLESFNHKTLRSKGSEVNIKVSLAKPKGKNNKKVFKSTSGSAKQELKATQRPGEPLEPRKGKHSISSNIDRVDAAISAGSARLEHLLADRALWRQRQASVISLSSLDHSHASTGRKRPFSSLDNGLYHSVPQEYLKFPEEISLHGRSFSHQEGPSNSYYLPHTVNFASGYKYIDRPMGYRGGGSSQSGGSRYPYRDGYC